MIDRLKIENFKSIEQADLNLGRLNIFLGTNASGKSNVFDALRVLQGIGYGFTVSEILDGKPKSAASEVWDGIRGGSANALRTAAKPTSGDMPPVIRFEISAHLPAFTSNTVDYSVALSSALGTIREEHLLIDQKEIYTSAPLSNDENAPVFQVRYYSGAKRGRAPHHSFEKHRPVLQQIARDGSTKQHREIMEALSGVLTNMQRLDPQPTVLRDYARASSARQMGEHGENFSALVKAICDDSETKAAYLTWLKELTPTEVDEVEILEGALKEPLFALRERGKVFPAPVLSDGTLRFAAITAAFFQPELPQLLTIEEIENGIHASRVRLLIEMLRSQAERDDVQIMVTTHSPIVLAWMKPEEYKHVFYCKRNADTGASEITPLSDIPDFEKIVSRQPIADLFAEGWMESAL
jgi:predicted ATPase